MYVAKCTHNKATIHRNELAESALGILEELCRLVWEPKGYTPKGGALYSLELVVVCFFLMCYWQFGKKKIYMLSGPDMIKYATQDSFVENVRRAMALLGEVIPHLVPEEVEAFIVPTTLFRFGYPAGCKTSEAVMVSHKTVWNLQKERRSKMKEGLPTDDIERNLILHLRFIEEYGKKWDLFHDPAKDVFFSQHDLLDSGVELQILEEYLDVPFTQLESLLRNLGQMERSLSRTLCSKN